jgi:Fe-S-cluster-containing dehydrogenase component/formate-dependent nitrite reductase membrane component NrfD
MRYGFALDQRTCIGCHACTVACKTEHEVPVGQFRTWVKYVDKGTYPSSTREFGVMRCNHCTDAPCIQICPTGALFKRPDGIVDFNNEACIGCKSCMQACPYDAIYIDEDTHTAAKCNMCAHRIDQGLEPACVVVCPTESIWVGDLDDPKSAISVFIATNEVQVRAPEQNTKPNMFYVGADHTVLEPLAAPVKDTYIWAKPDAHRRDVSADLPTDPTTGAYTSLNTAHPRPWGWRVTTYLWTKAWAAGAVMVAALAIVFGLDRQTYESVVAPAIGLFGAAVTGTLLVWDLKRPERFLFIFLKSNFRSWLVLGAYMLTGFSGLAVLWIGAHLIGADGAIPWLAGLAALAGVMTAGYTGFLFGQAEGRDLWQSPLLFWHLVVQAFMVGAGVALIGVVASGADDRLRELVVRVLVLSTVLHLLMLLIEYGGKHASRNAAAAAHMIVRGRYARLFWLGAVGLGVLAVLLALPAWSSPTGLALASALVAGVLVQVALLAYESVFVRAGQDVPLS